MPDSIHVQPPGIRGSVDLPLRLAVPEEEEGGGELAVEERHAPAFLGDLDSVHLAPAPDEYDDDDYSE